MRLPDGRALAYIERGDPRGAPVFVFHGLPGSRLQQHPDDSIARSAGLRLIHIDRPGFGVSLPQRGRTIADLPHDIAALADALAVERFAVAGVSGGGPYAISCAALLGRRISRAALVSSVGPPGTMQGRMTRVARSAFFVAPRARWVLKLPLAVTGRLASWWPHRFLDTLASHLAPADGEILARREVRAILARDLREALRQGVNPVIHELALLARPWNLPVEHIASAVALWHGEEDWLVPASATRYLASVIPGARVELLPGAGHFMIFDRWPDVCAWLAGEGA